MGQGDFRQPRLNSTFSAFDYVQHKFRHFDGRFLSTLRGQRVTWALFNIALRESCHYVGSLVHKQSGQTVLTKQHLKQLLAEREDQQHLLLGNDMETSWNGLFAKCLGTHAGVHPTIVCRNLRCRKCTDNRTSSKTKFQ